MVNFSSWGGVEKGELLGVYIKRWVQRESYSSGFVYMKRESEEERQKEELRETERERERQRDREREGLKERRKSTSTGLSC